MATITINSGVHGIVDPSGVIHASVGAMFPITFTPDIGYYLSDCSLAFIPDGMGGGYFNYTVFGDDTITSTFSVMLAQQIVVSSKATTQKGLNGGTVVPNGNTLLNVGSTQLYTFAPASGFAINDVKIDGRSFGPITSYLFTAGALNSTISVEFYKTQKNCLTTYDLGNGVSFLSGMNREDIAQPNHPVSTSINGSRTYEVGTYIRR